MRQHGEIKKAAVSGRERYPMSSSRSALPMTDSPSTTKLPLRNEKAEAVPICVDLDGTLVRSDTLIELLLKASRSQPWLLVLSIYWIMKGKAYLKEKIAEHVTISPEHLPYNSELISYLKAQKAAGRKLLLVTASHRSWAEKIADHVGIFDDVIATDGSINLRGANKANILCQRFGEGAYTYAGNDAHDLQVWRSAKSAIIVEAPQRVSRRVSVPIETEMKTGDSKFRLVIRAMRVYQWTKNLLVFVPVITAGALSDLTALGAAAIAFYCFSMISSGVYLLNDVVDLESDRLHPTKKNRPFASGQLPLTWGLTLGPGLMAIGLAFSFAVGIWLFSALLAYVVVTSLYSAYLKTIPLVDVFTLAGLYVLRILAGGIATGYLPSVWLLTFAGLFFLGLALLKRFVEFSAEDSSENEKSRRGYRAEDKTLLLVMGMSTSFSAAIILALYVESNTASAIYEVPVAIWAFVPLCLFWQCQAWLAAVRGEVHDDPIIYAAKDTTFWITVLAASVIYAIAVGGIS